MTAQPLSLGSATKIGAAQLGQLEAVQSLTEKQRLVVLHLLKGEDADAAIALAGYAAGTPAITIIGSGSVQRALQAACDAELGGVVRVKALRAMEALLGADTPAATRFSAAKFVLERGKADQGGDKPLAEMTPGELMEFIQRAEVTMREAKDARIIDVTPQSGA